MQSTSYSMINTIRYSFGFGSGSYADSGTYYPTLPNYELHNVFKTFLRVKIEKDRFELPVFLKNNMLKHIYSNKAENRIEYVMPIYCNNHVETVGTSNSLFKKLQYCSSDRSSRYIEIHTNKGEKYYGATGVVFDKDMTPLLFNVAKCKIERTDGNFTIVVTGLKSYIHPKVFCNNGLMEKCILNKIIPVYLQGVPATGFIHLPQVRVDFGRCLGELDVVPEIIIADIGDIFICSSVAPSAVSNDEKINDMIINNMDSIFDTLGLQL